MIRRGAGGIWGARHAMHVRLGGAAIHRMIVGARREDLGRRRPGVIAWRPLSDDWEGAGRDSGCKACHARTIVGAPFVG